MNGYEGSQEIKHRLQQLVEDRFNIKIKNYDEISDKNLLGSEICFAPRDLLYIYFDVEKTFDINIPQKDIIEGNFSTLGKIEGIINRQYHSKESISS